MCYNHRIIAMRRIPTWFTNLLLLRLPSLATLKVLEVMSGALEKIGLHTHASNLEGWACKRNPDRGYRQGHSNAQVSMATKDNSIFSW